MYSDCTRLVLVGCRWMWALASSRLTPLSLCPCRRSRWRTACASSTTCRSNWRPRLPPSSAASRLWPSPSAGVRARATPAPSAASARRASRWCRRWDGKAVTPQPRGFFLTMTLQQTFLCRASRPSLCLDNQTVFCRRLTTLASLFHVVTISQNFFIPVREVKSAVSPGCLPSLASVVHRRHKTFLHADLSLFSLLLGAPSVPLTSHWWRILNPAGQVGSSTPKPSRRTCRCWNPARRRRRRRPAAECCRTSRPTKAS